MLEMFTKDDHFSDAGYTVASGYAVRGKIAWVGLESEVWIFRWHEKKTGKVYANEDCKVNKILIRRPVWLLSVRWTFANCSFC